MVTFNVIPFHMYQYSYFGRPRLCCSGYDVICECGQINTPCTSCDNTTLTTLHTENSLVINTATLAYSFHQTVASNKPKRA